MSNIAATAKLSNHVKHTSLTWANLVRNGEAELNASVAVLVVVSVRPDGIGTSRALSAPCSAVRVVLESVRDGCQCTTAPASMQACACTHTLTHTHTAISNYRLHATSQDWPQLMGEETWVQALQCWRWLPRHPWWQGWLSSLPHWWQGQRQCSPSGQQERSGAAVYGRTRQQLHVHLLLPVTGHSDMPCYRCKPSQSRCLVMHIDMYALIFRARVIQINNFQIVSINLQWLINSMDKFTNPERGVSRNLLGHS